METRPNPITILLKQRSILAGRLAQAHKSNDELTSYRVGNLQRELAQVNSQLAERTTRRKQKLT